MKIFFLAKSLTGQVHVFRWEYLNYGKNDIFGSTYHEMERLNIWHKVWTEHTSTFFLLASSEISSIRDRIESLLDYECIQKVSFY